MGLDALEIVLRCEEVFRSSLPDHEVEAIYTVGDLYRAVCCRVPHILLFRCGFAGRRTHHPLKATTNQQVRASARITNRRVEDTTTLTQAGAATQPKRPTCLPQPAIEAQAA